MSSEEKIQNTIRQVQEENNELDKKENELQIQNPMAVLQSRILEFFQNKMAAIGTKSQLREAIEQSLLADLSNNKMSVAQKIMLLDDLSKKDLLESESLIGVFKPQPNTPSIFDMAKQEDSAKGPEEFEKLKKEDNEALQALGQFLQAVKQTTKDKDIEDAEVVEGED